MDKKKISTDSLIESTQNNNLHIIISKNNQNNNTKDQNNNNINYGLNTSNTIDHNIVVPRTIEKLKKIVNTADILEIEIINSLNLQGCLEVDKCFRYDRKF